MRYPPRPIIIGAATILLFAVGLQFVPQFNLLNYYYALACAFVVPFVAGLVVTSLPSTATPERDLWTAAIVAIICLSIPLMVVGVGALFISNCAPLRGLVHYAVGPTIGTAYATLMSIWLRRLAPGRAKRWFICTWLGLAIANLIWFYTRPPIYTFNIFIGYMNGAVYDPLIRIHDDWALYRWICVAITGAWLALVTRKNLTTRTFLGLGLGLLALTLAVTSHFQRTSAHIQDSLGGRHETDHFVIIYDTDSDVANRITELAQDHEFRFAQLEQELGIRPDGKITSFVYRNPAQKQRLMGAGRTYIAKPWSRMIHLNNLTVGATVLKHELTHVFGAAINHEWLRIPTLLGVIPKMALVEGFAVAHEPARGRLTPHQWSAAMRTLGIAPPLIRLLSTTGFLLAGSSKAYTLTGSFIRYLRETHGQDSIRTLYRTGSFDNAFGRPLKPLIREWETFVDDRARVPLSPDDIALAEWRFDMPSRFHRICALEVAEWEDQAIVAQKRGDYETAIQLLEKVYSFDPSIDKRLSLLMALVRGRHLERGIQLAEGIADDETAGAVLRARGLQSVADIQWLQNNIVIAHNLYKELVTLPLDLSTQRRLLVSVYATESQRHQDIQKGIGRYLNWVSAPKDVKGIEATNHIRGLAEQYPDDPVLTYLRARRESSLQHTEKAVSAYSKALQLGLPYMELTREAHLQRGHLYRRQGNIASAKRDYQTARNLFSATGYIALMDDWIAFCDWLMLRPAQPPN